MEGSSSTVLLTVSLIVSMPRDLQGGADEGWGQITSEGMAGT